MARRGHHSLEQIKNMILGAAEELVIEGGLSQLRVRNIAIKIGYTVGSVYMVFDNMTDLILHVKGRTLDALIKQMEEITTTNPEQRLGELAGVYIHFASKNFNRWSMLFENRLPKNTAIPAWYQQKVDDLYGIFEKQFAFLSPGLSYAQRKQTTLAFQGGIHGICTLMLNTPISDLNDMDLEESIKLFVRRFIYDGQMKSLAVINQANALNVGCNWGANAV
jgi:AcrR family transcriptional regulator